MSEDQEAFEKIALLENEVQARLLETELKARDIPHALQSYYDSAYDGLFQMTEGWGRVEAPARCRETILGILESISSGAELEGEDAGE